MNKEEYLSKLHLELLVIMDEIDRLCSKHNIKYYLVGGSLIGAIRHGGFIPWDDDMDIAMPRTDMLRFIDIAVKELNENFEIEWFSTRPNYYQFFPKITRKKTLFVQNELKENCQSGIFVDIFPLDLSPSYSKNLEFHRNLIKVISGSMISRNRKVKNRSFKENVYYCVGAILGNKLLYHCLERQLKKLSSMGSTHFVNLGSQYKLYKQTMPVDWYGDGNRMQFENRYYMVPSKYKKVLTSIYGSNYMDLPPLEKRRCHYPARVVFSDGTEIDFDSPSHFVSIEEQNS